MKRLATLAALAALTIPATAHGSFAQRVVQTTCDRNVVLTYKIIDLTPRYTQVGCPDWTFFDFGKNIYVTWHRPVTDLEGAVRSARVWWPACEPTWYGTTDQWANGHHYYNWYLHVCV